MYTEDQLQKIGPIKEKWKTWEQSRVSLFTHEDRKIVNELRVAAGMAPSHTSCNACFMDAVRELMRKIQDL